MLRCVLALCCIIYPVLFQVKNAQRQDWGALSISLLFTRNSLYLNEDVEIPYDSQTIIPIPTTTAPPTNSSIFQMKMHDNTSQENKTMEFFPWNDGYDYNAICNNIISVISSFKNNKIVTSGRSGGLGHKFLTIYNVLTASLVLERPYFINLEQVYWNNMNSCFQQLQFTGNMRDLRVCTVKSHCISPKSFLSIPNRDVLISDVRFDLDVLCNKRVLKKINSYKIFGKPVTCTEYKRIVLRLLLNPTPDVTNIILRSRKQFGNLKNLIGVHIRCGGNAANSKERKVIIKPSTFDQIPKLIKPFVTNKTKIFLSTDSSQMEHLIQKSFQKGTVLSAANFSRGHTTSHAVKGFFIKRAILDIHLVAHGNRIIYTQKSGFSNMCVSISRARSLHVIPSLI